MTLLEIITIVLVSTIISSIVMLIPYFNLKDKMDTMSDDINLSRNSINILFSKIEDLIVVIDYFNKVNTNKIDVVMKYSDENNRFISVIANNYKNKSYSNAVNSSSKVMNYRYGKIGDSPNNRDMSALKSLGLYTGQQ